MKINFDQSPAGVLVRMAKFHGPIFYFIGEWAGWGGPMGPWIMENMNTLIIFYFLLFLLPRFDKKG